MSTEENATGDGSAGVAEPAPKTHSRPLVWLVRLLELAVICGILAGTGWVAYRWMTNPPKAERRPPNSQATLVEVTAARTGAEQVVLRGLMGSVIPAKSIQFAARVNGQIIDASEHFVPGGVFKESEEILRIDPRDYELAVKQRAGEITKMESDVRLEMGQQAVARREFELLGDDGGGSTDLLLREPQLAAKQAALEVARAALDKARLDLERTSIRAPFDAVVLARAVDLGSYVAPGTPLATLAATDEFWVDVSIPVDELRWVDLPEPGKGDGAPVRVYNQAAWGPGVFRKGAVTRLIPELETRGRMARILVAVKDPLEREDATDGRPLLLNTFVRIEIDGRSVDGVSKVPRPALHEGNLLWLMSPENTLEVRPVELVWGDPDFVFVSGLHDGEKLVVSDLAAPIPGMLLRTADQGGAAPPPAAADGPA